MINAALTIVGGFSRFTLFNFFRVANQKDIFFDISVLQRKKMKQRKKNLDVSFFESFQETTHQGRFFLFFIEFFSWVRYFYTFETFSNFLII